MERTPYIIAKEGWKNIAISFALFFVLYVFGFSILAFFALCITLLIAYGYRDVERVINNDDMAILAVCDGKVYHIETLDDMVLVSIETSIIDAPIIRTPYDCKIENINKIYGVSITPSNIKSKYLNTRANLVCKGVIDTKIEFVTSIFANDINIFCADNTELRRGSRFGLMYDGVVKVYLPKNVRLKVDIGDKIKAGESIIGFFDKQ